MSRQIVILAAGKGTRMGSPVPKVLIPLRDRPVIEHLLEEANAVAQDGPPVLVVGFKREEVEAVLGPKYRYAVQTEQRGTAHAVAAAKPLVSADNFIVLYGDMPFITAASIEQLCRMHESSGSKLSMFTCIVPDFSGVYSHLYGFGRIVRNDTGDLVCIRELADCNEEEKTITELNPGIYMFNSDWLWSHIDQIGHGNAQQEYYLTDIIEIALKSGEVVKSMPVPVEEVFGINTPEQLEYAHKLTL